MEPQLRPTEMEGVTSARMGAGASSRTRHASRRSPHLGQRLSRRMVLRGLGAGLALPLLDAMLPAAARASNPSRNAARVRLVFCYVPNGAHMPGWRPAASGKLNALPETFQSLEPHREELLFLSGLGLKGAEAQGDGPGDHARSMAAFLTGAHPFKTDGKNIRNGISVDQFAAAKQPQPTPFPTLELGLEGGAVVGQCDSGYSCAYSNHLSWRTESTPVPKDVNPQAVFDRICGLSSGDADTDARRRLDAERKSILDFVSGEAQSLQARVGTDDRRKLDEYLYAVRDIEKRLTTATAAMPPIDPPMPRPAGVPEDYGDHARLMLDLLVLALRTDRTRIVTFAFANEGSNRAYREIDIVEGHHELSHHGNNAEKMKSIARINAYHASLFGHFLSQMKATRDGDATLLDQSIVVYGSGIEDGNSHYHHNLPIVLAGRGGGVVQPGQSLDFPLQTPLTNLYVSMLNAFGIDVERFGDSTGRVELA